MFRLILPPMLACFQFLKGAKLFLLQDLHICCYSHKEFFPYHSSCGILFLSSYLNLNAISSRYIITQSKVVPINITCDSTFFFSCIVITMFCNHTLLSLFNFRVNETTSITICLAVSTTYVGSTFLDHLVICSILFCFTVHR